MQKDFITLSTREIERLRIINKVIDKDMTQVKASEILGISDRQIRNIIQKIKEKGTKGIRHGNRGRESPHKMAKELEDHIGLIVKRKYPDFGPTLASEKLWSLKRLTIKDQKRLRKLKKKLKNQLRRRRNTSPHESSLEKTQSFPPPQLVSRKGYLDERQTGHYHVAKNRTFSRGRKQDIITWA